MEIRPFSIAAFILTVLAFIFVVLGFFLPHWWSINSVDTTRSYGLWIVSDCYYGDCVIRSATEIQGGKEFLFVCKVFETFGALLTVLALILHVIYIPVRKPMIRSISIYCLGATGLFLLLAIIIFGAKHQALGEEGQHVSIGASFYISLLGGVLSGVASLLTAKASVEKAKRHDEDEDKAGVL
ncbi:hypothetical protein SNE40_001681 [Patella caerulea]|uniref:Uncharacterized protein n=1 Tax=Patella caerulea TaxID=87958 RepID=A0AAN8PY37_PATCE